MELEKKKELVRMEMEEFETEIHKIQGQLNLLSDMIKEIRSHVAGLQFRMVLAEQEGLMKKRKKG